MRTRDVASDEGAGGWLVEPARKHARVPDQVVDDGALVRPVDLRRREELSEALRRGWQLDRDRRDR
jgi:hypothetical protein